MTKKETTADFTIGVLLVNYNQWELTEKCVISLLASKGVKVLIGLVDNNSHGSAPEWVKDTQQIKFHRNKTNAGLTEGNNQAFAMLSGENIDYVLILNNDTEVYPDALSLLANYLDRHPETGIAAPAIPYAGKPATIWSAGGKYSYWRMHLKQKYETVSDLPEHPLEMDQVTGCAIMMRWNDYKKAGMQDPGLFVYYEDTDLCFRVKKMGLNIQLIPEAIVLHHVSISVGGVYSPFAIYFTHRNRYIVASRHLSWLPLIVFNVYYTVITLLKTAIYAINGHGHLVFWMWLGLIHGVKNQPQKRPKGLFSEESR